MKFNVLFIISGLLFIILGAVRINTVNDFNTISIQILFTGIGLVMVIAGFARIIIDKIDELTNHK